MSSWASLPVYQDSTMVPMASTKAKIDKPTTRTCSEPIRWDPRPAKSSNQEEGWEVDLDVGSTGPFPCSRAAVSAVATALDAGAGLCGGAAALAEERDFLRAIGGHSR